MELSSRYEGRGHRAVAHSAPPSLGASRAVGSVRVQPPEAPAVRLPACGLRSRRQRMAEVRGWGPALRLPKPRTWTPRTLWGVKGTRDDPPRWKPGEQSGADPGGRSGRRCTWRRASALPSRCLRRTPHPCVLGSSPVFIFQSHVRLFKPHPWLAVPFFQTFHPSTSAFFEFFSKSRSVSRCPVPLSQLPARLHTYPLPALCLHPSLKKNVILVINTQ